MSRKPNTEKHKLGDISKHALTSSGAAAYAKRTGIRHSALGHSRGVFAGECRPPFTSLSLRSLRLAHKSTSKLVLLVLVTRVCQAAFRELRSHRGETIDIRGIDAFTVSARVTPRRCPLPGEPQNSAGGLKTRRMRCRSRFGSAFGVILVALALFIRPFRFTRAFRMRSGLHFGTLWTPKSLLPSRREHRFQKINVSNLSSFWAQNPLSK